MKKQSIHRVLSAAPLMLFSLAMTASTALAHGDAKHDKPDAAAPISMEEKAFGRQGNPKKISRAIVIEMTDAMRFVPAEISIKQDETIQFIVKNKGKMMHEMVLGTMEELQEHGELMKKHPDMEHDEPYMAHVKPGGKEEMVWQFTKAGEFHFACLLPGHFEAGMIGRIKVDKEAGVADRKRPNHAAMRMTSS